MPYRIEVNSPDGYIHVHHYDAFTFDELNCSRADYGALIESTGINRMLVDVSQARADISILESFEFSASHRLVLPLTVKIAVVADTRAFDKAKFSEDVSVNRGFNVRMFHDAETALEWLLNDIDSNATD